MAELALRKRLAAAAGVVLDDEILDQIHNRLQAVENGKIPLTLKYEFFIEDGEIHVDISSKCNLSLSQFKLRIKSDGNQMGLFDEDSEEEQEEQKAETAEPKPKARKKAAKKRAVRKGKAKGAEKKSPSEAVANVQAGINSRSVAQDRLQVILENNTQLYKDGIINRLQAESAGVDVDAIDAMSNQPPNLSPEEMAALSE